MPDGLKWGLVNVAVLTDEPEPVGTDATSAQRRRARRSAEYRAEEHRLAPLEQVARMVIGRRSELNLTVEELAERMGDSASAIRRIESAQHATSVRTLERLAERYG